MRADVLIEKAKSENHINFTYHNLVFTKAQPMTLAFAHWLLRSCFTNMDAARHSEAFHTTRCIYCITVKNTGQYCSTVSNLKSKAATNLVSHSALTQTGGINPFSHATHLR